MKRLVSPLVGSLILQTLLVAAAPLETRTSYQGKLSENGQAAHGAYDLRLTLYDSQEGGESVGLTLTNSNVEIRDGLFSTSMDFTRPQAEVQGLPDKCEPADDVRALSTLVHALRGALVAVGVVKGGA